jgi:hypothetical protein
MAQNCHLGGLGSAQAPMIITRKIKSPTSSLASSTAPVYLYRHIYIYKRIRWSLSLNQGSGDPSIK